VIILLLFNTARGIQYLHEKGIAHLDLKPANIILDEEYNPFLIDFGLSIFTSEKGNEKGTEETIGETIGEKGYISPEMGKEGIDSQKCDIYSFGV